MMLLSGAAPAPAFWSVITKRSFQYTTLANPSFLIYTYLHLPTILAAIFLKEKFNTRAVFLRIAAVDSRHVVIPSSYIVTPEGLTPRPTHPKYTFFRNAIAQVRLVRAAFTAQASVSFSRYPRGLGDSNVRSWWNFLFGSLSIVVPFVWHHFPAAAVPPEKVNGVTQLDALRQIITTRVEHHVHDARPVLSQSHPYAHHRLRRVLPAHPCLSRNSALRPASWLPSLPLRRPSWRRFEEPL